MPQSPEPYNIGIVEIRRVGIVNEISVNYRSYRPKREDIIVKERLTVRDKPRNKWGVRTRCGQHGETHLPHAEGTFWGAWNISCYSWVPGTSMGSETL